MKQLVWSPHRLLLWLRCPYAYFLQYKEKVRVPKEWFLIFGGAVHEAIKICHRGNRHQAFMPTLERPLFFKSALSFGKFWCGLWKREIAKAEKETGIKWSKEGQQEELQALGWAMLAGKKDGSYKGYYHCILNPPFPARIIALEFTIPKVTLWGFPFSGRIDQLWRTDQGTAIIDITTGRSTDVKFLQMTAYDLALQEYCRINPKAGKLFGEGARQHFVWNLRTERLIRARLQDPLELRRQLEAAVAGIQDGDFHQTQQDDVCRWCEFKEMCGKIMGESLPATSDLVQLELEGLSLALEGPRALQPRQGYFKKGAEGGWFKGAQVMGKQVNDKKA